MYILHSYVMLRCKDSCKTVLTDYVSNPRIEQLHRTYLYVLNVIQFQVNILKYLHQESLNHNRIYNILSLDCNGNVKLLIGHDMPYVHHVCNQISCSQSQTFSQRSPLGWAVIGEVCIVKFHPPKKVNKNKTNMLNDGRRDIFPVGHNNINVKDNNGYIFLRTSFDKKITPSVTDRKFVNQMDEEFHKDTDGYWSAPIAFKKS